MIIEMRLRTWMIRIRDQRQKPKKRNKNGFLSHINQKLEIISKLKNKIKLLSFVVSYLHTHSLSDISLFFLSFFHFSFLLLIALQCKYEYKY